MGTFAIKRSALELQVLRKTTCHVASTIALEGGTFVRAVTLGRAARASRGSKFSISRCRSSTLMLRALANRCAVRTRVGKPTSIRQMVGRRIEMR
jgi:hypothetical protein